MDRFVEVRPARRGPAKLYFTVQNEQGAISLIVDTDWRTPGARQAQARHMEELIATKPQWYTLQSELDDLMSIKTSGIARHAPNKMGEHDAYRECCYIPGGHCYLEINWDSLARELVNTLVLDGDVPVWTRLEELHAQEFADTPEDKASG